MADAREKLIADRLIAISAFRYALGRMTYMVDHTAGWLERNVDALQAHDRDLIIREIDEAGERDGLGMDFDATRWRRCQNRMLVANGKPARPAADLARAPDDERSERHG